MSDETEDAIMVGELLKKGKDVDDDDDFDALTDLSERVPDAVTIPLWPAGVSIPPLAARVEGLVDIEADAGVIEARERVEKFLDRWRSTFKAANSAAVTIGVRPGTAITPAKLAKLEVELEAAGRDPQLVAEYVELSRAVVRAAEVVRVAVPQITAAMDAARRAANPAAAEYLKATFTPWMRDYLCTLASGSAHRGRVEQVRAAGLSIPNWLNRTGGSLDIDPESAAPLLRRLVAEGYLSREEVNAKLPKHAQI